MGYNKELFAEIRRRMEEGRLRALEEAENRRRQIHARLPEVAGIDRELARTGLMIMEEISKGKEGLSERLENIRLDNLDLQAQREACLIRAGYPADYDQPPYNCKICKDSGYNGQQMCTCLKTALSKEGMKRAGVDRLFETQRFETFRLQYYQQDARILQLMKKQLDYCQSYATQFSAHTKENLLFYGGTGLGKTHLSTAIAGVVVEKGFDVLYESAPNLFSVFEAERFGKGNTSNVTNTARYFQCDLLIIDDLGAEMSNTFTVGVLYNLLNTRVVAGLPTIISTNLTSDEIRNRYTDRVASRLFGEFSLLRFEGRDIRMQKKGML